MQSWGAFELMRQQAEEILAAQQRKPQPAPPNPVPRLTGMASPAEQPGSIEVMRRKVIRINLKFFILQPHPRARARPCAGRRLPAGIVRASEPVAARESRNWNFESKWGGRPPLLPIPVRIRIGGTALLFNGRSP